ncbi:MAG: NAD-binding protein, partial [Deinococcota bacterium]|nr:NAD-binding protein [Deinococcota bacterium]
TEDDPKSVFTVALLQKDIRLAANMCESHNVPLLLTRALQAIADLAVAQGLGDQDSAALVRLYRKRS